MAINATVIFGLGGWANLFQPLGRCARLVCTFGPGKIHEGELSHADLMWTEGGVSLSGLSMYLEQ